MPKDNLKSRTIRFHENIHIVIKHTHRWSTVNTEFGGYDCYKIVSNGRVNIFIRLPSDYVNNILSDHNNPH
jgi:hypothetical protein